MPQILKPFHAVKINDEEILPMSNCSNPKGESDSDKNL